MHTTTSKRVCPLCHGYGDLWPDNYPEVCEICHGHGYVFEEFDQGVFWRLLIRRQDRKARAQEAKRREANNWDTVESEPVKTPQLSDASPAGLIFIGIILLLYFLRGLF